MDHRCPHRIHGIFRAEFWTTMTYLVRDRDLLLHSRWGRHNEYTMPSTAYHYSLRYAACAESRLGLQMLIKFVCNMHYLREKSY